MCREVRILGFQGASTSGTRGGEFGREDDLDGLRGGGRFVAGARGGLFGLLGFLFFEKRGFEDRSGGRSGFSGGRERSCGAAHAGTRRNRRGR